MAQSNYDEEDVIEISQYTIPDQEMEIERYEISLGKLFEKKDGKPRRFDSRIERTGEIDILEYRIPTRQRYGATKWQLCDKQLLIDSVFKGFPIQGITSSKQSAVEKGQPMLWKDIEDGASRLGVLQAYYEDGFPYCGKKFSELNVAHQKRFEQYVINIDNVSGDNITPEAIDEVFQRLNRGKPLQDADRYYSMERISPLVQTALKLMNEPYWDKKIMKTYDFGDKKRQILPEVCALVATLAFGEEYTSGSSGRLYPILRLPIPDGFWEKTKNFCAHYFRIIDRVEKNERIVNSQMSWHKTSKQLGFILHDYLNTSSPHSLKEKEDMWVDIMKIARTVEDFMYGRQTIWNGLPKGVRQNFFKNDYIKKLERIYEFYNKETREALCKKEVIIWQVKDKQP